MLGNRDAVANIAVKDLDRARKFYEDRLGLKPLMHEGNEAIIFQSGSTSLIVYHSQYAGTNQATVVTWSVGEYLEMTVSALRSRGICFEHYDMPGVRREGDIHISGDMQVAWFKDPDGNILCISNGKTNGTSVVNID